MSCNIIVGVRVRPFNKKELKSNDINIIKMNQNETEIHFDGKINKFVFDHSLWSFDKPDNNSSLEYINQMSLFDKFGKSILINAWEGYNCSFFAYGQTGSGKTFSVMGYEGHKGLVPMICEELFIGIERKTLTLKDNEKLKVTIGILEVYNEKIRDLLNVNVQGHLELRHEKERGFYVPEQKMFSVNSYAEILQKINIANKQRTIASTNMNETSSRAHTIVTLQFAQTLISSQKKLNTIISLINLIDLAGSEQIKKSKSEGNRFIEARNINLSLSSLGKCIRALYKGQSHVPYRDSVLTKLLKNALGGNSKTILLATISPSHKNYHETLSTLRFADRAKTIRTNAKVNVSETNKLIKKLEEENKKLSKEIESIQKSKLEGNISELKEKLIRNKKKLDEFKRKRDEEEKLAENKMKKQQKEEQSYRRKLKEIPHIFNLNDDRSLNKVLVYFFEKSSTIIGNSKAVRQPTDLEKIDIKLNGINILPIHAEIINDATNNKVTIKSHNNSVILINGEKVTDEKELHHYDRLLFGTTLFFFFFDPKNFKSHSDLIAEPNIDDARQEVAYKSTEYQNMENERLLEDLSKYHPLVKEANTMATAMSKGILFDLRILNSNMPGFNNSREPKVVVHAFISSKNREYFMELDDFYYHRFVMVDIYNEFVEGKSIENEQMSNDPFYPNSSLPVCIGFVNMILSPLTHCVHMRDTLSIMNSKVEFIGELGLSAMLCNNSWSPLEERSLELWEHMDVFIEIVIKSCSFQQSFILKFSKIFCRFKFQNRVYQSNVSPVTNQYVIFEDHFRIEKRNLDSQTLNYFDSQHLNVEIWGYYESNFELQLMDNFLNSLSTMIERREQQGHKTVKIKSILKIVPENFKKSILPTNETITE